MNPDHRFLETLAVTRRIAFPTAIRKDVIQAFHQELPCRITPEVELVTTSPIVCAEFGLQFAQTSLPCTKMT